MKITIGRIIGFVAVLISGASLVVSIAAYRISSNVYQASRSDKEVERRLQQHAGQIDKKSQISRTLREFRSLSYLYFFAETASQDRSVPELEARHVEHHRLEAQLVSSLETVGDSFGPCVKIAASEFREYLGTYPWEQQIQNVDFHEKIRDDHSGKEGVGDMISRAVFVNQFDYLTGLLEGRMDKEMVSTDPNASEFASKNQWWELPCETYPFSVEIATPSHEVKVNERMIFTANVKITEGYVYACNWSGDEAQEWNDREFACHFTHPGVKIVNLTVSVFRNPRNELSGGLVKTIFARDKVSVK